MREPSEYMVDPKLPSQLCNILQPDDIQRIESQAFHIALNLRILWGILKGEHLGEYARQVRLSETTRILFLLLLLEEGIGPLLGDELSPSISDLDYFE